MMSAYASKRILVVDDDATFRERLATSLRRRGHEVRTSATRYETMETLDLFSPECAVVDLRLEGESGLSVARDLREREPNIRILILTGYGSIATAVDAMRLGAIDYLAKPADTDQIEFTLFGENETVRPGIENPNRVPSLDRVEWEHMQRVLHDCAGNISETARRLGIERRTLQRKLQKFPPLS